MSQENHLEGMMSCIDQAIDCAEKGLNDEVLLHVNMARVKLRRFKEQMRKEGLDVWARETREDDPALRGVLAGEERMG